MLEDRLLIWRLRSGREDGLVGVYHKYKNYLAKIAHSLLADSEQVEDVVQDVFLSLANAAPRLKLHGNLKGYLVACMVNRVRNIRKAARMRSAVRLDEISEPCTDRNGPDQWVILNEELKRVHDAMSHLPYEQREVIALHLRGGLKFKQIAGLQGISINTAQSRYRYGLEKLRHLLDGEAAR